ncbi:MAG: AraC family transcriptional regulator [Chloroflexota bacterium]
MTAIQTCQPRHQQQHQQQYQPGTDQAYRQRIQVVLDYIEEHLDDAFTDSLCLDQLADLAGFSIYHFHRIFRAYVGIPLAAYIRRLRFDRAARHLLETDWGVIDIALEAGYGTHSSFTKAFRQQFGVTPSQFRAMSRQVNHMGDRSADRYVQRTPNLFEAQEAFMSQSTITAEIVTLPDTRVLYTRATEVMNGNAFQSANEQAFGQLMQFMQANDLQFGKWRQIVAVYPEDVQSGQESIFDAGLIFNDTFDTTSLGDVEAGGMNWHTLPSGRWAKFVHKGPYSTLWQTWNAIYRDWLPSSGETLRSAAGWEDYVNDPSETPPEELLSELYIAIE